MADYSSKLALGTVQFGLDYGISNEKGKTDSGQVRGILDKALALGIDTLDTARAYGNSESVLGSSGGDRFKLISKFLAPEGDLNLADQLEESLTRLNKDSLYGYLGHSASVFLDNPQVFEDLIAQKEQGRIRKIGYSIYTPDELEQLLELGMKPDLIQIPYSVLDRRFEGYFEELKNDNVEIHTRSSFLQGLFFMNANTLHPFFDSVKPYIRQLQRLFDSSEKLAAGLLAFCTANECIDKVVFGINDENQLEKNCQALEENTVTLPVLTEHLAEEIYLPYLWPRGK